MISKTKLKQVLGYYLPNRFILSLPSIKLPLTNNRLDDLTVFFHEYVHLLQNIFTVSGWTSMAFETLKYEAILDVAKQDRVYEIPLSQTVTNESIKHKIQTSSFYTDYLFNCNEALNNSSIKSCVKTPNIRKRIIDGFPFDKENKFIEVYSDFIVDGIIKEIEINYLVLIESMAYLIEQEYALSNIPSPDYPYNIIGTLFDRTVLKDRKDLQIVIIYLSLQSQFPTILFEKIYTVIFERDLLMCEDIPTFCRNIMLSLPDDFDTVLTQNIDMLKIVIGQFCNNIKRFEKGKESSRWLMDYLTKFIDTFIEDPLVFIKPLLMNESPRTICEVLDYNYFLIQDSTMSLSTPKKEQHNDVFGITFLSNVFHFIDYLVFYEQDDGLGYDPRICPVYNNCDLKDFKNSDCVDKPYKLGIEKKVNDSLCDYGLVAHMFFVHEVPIVMD